MLNKNVKIVSSFYKYAKIETPLELRLQIFDLCNSLNLKGRILLGEEGINGSVYGKIEDVNNFESELRKNQLFYDIDFKEQGSEKKAFRKLFVRVRKEIVHSGLDVDLKNTAGFVTPKQLKEMLDNNEDVVLIDMRNDYEAKIGKFKGAVTLPLKNFRDMAFAIDKIRDLKNKKIVAYCTGGIRCEKASAFLKENGFENVMQLKGGILKFGEEYPDTYWEGKCFVFDDRLAIDINKKNIEPLNVCEWCSKKCDDYMNCHNLECDRLFICCKECLGRHNKSCSEECLKSERRRKEIVIAA